jgi:tRNA 2-thiouridine synthesizing protein A
MSDPRDIEEYDLRGLQCPLPVLKTRNRMRKLDAGDCIWVITDDPLAGLDIPNFCNEYDQELVDQKTGEGQELLFLIKRTDTKL